MVSKKKSKEVRKSNETPSLSEPLDLRTVQVLERLVPLNKTGSKLNTDIASHDQPGQQPTHEEQRTQLDGENMEIVSTFFRESIFSPLLPVSNSFLYNFSSPPCCNEPHQQRTPLSLNTSACSLKRKTPPNPNRVKCIVDKKAPLNNVDIPKMTYPIKMDRRFVKILNENQLPTNDVPKTQPYQLPRDTTKLSNVSNGPEINKSANQLKSHLALKTSLHRTRNVINVSKKQKINKAYYQSKSELLTPTSLTMDTTRNMLNVTKSQDTKKSHNQPNIPSTIPTSAHGSNINDLSGPNLTNLRNNAFQSPHNEHNCHKSYHFYHVLPPLDNLVNNLTSNQPNKNNPPCYLSTAVTKYGQQLIQSNSSVSGNNSKNDTNVFELTLRAGEIPHNSSEPINSERMLVEKIPSTAHNNPHCCHFSENFRQKIQNCSLPGNINEDEQNKVEVKIEVTQKSHYFNDSINSERIVPNELNITLPIENIPSTIRSPQPGHSSKQQMIHYSSSGSRNNNENDYSIAEVDKTVIPIPYHSSDSKRMTQNEKKVILSDENFPSPVQNVLNYDHDHSYVRKPSKNMRKILDKNLNLMNCSVQSVFSSFIRENPGQRIADGISLTSENNENESTVMELDKNWIPIPQQLYNYNPTTSERIIPTKMTPTISNENISSTGHSIHADHSYCSQNTSNERGHEQNSSTFHDMKKPKSGQNVFNCHNTYVKNPSEETKKMLDENSLMTNSTSVISNTQTKQVEDRVNNAEQKTIPTITIKKGNKKQLKITTKKTIKKKPARRLSMKSSNNSAVQKNERLSRNKEIQHEIIPFVQNEICTEEAPLLPQCLDCWQGSQQEGNFTIENFCRFWRFRKLVYTDILCENLKVYGFLDPNIDYSQRSLRLWVPFKTEPTPFDLDTDIAQDLFKNVGDQFCRMVKQEVSPNSLRGKAIIWKETLRLISESCDQCEDNIFDKHLFCKRCGYVICTDCYKNWKEKDYIKRPSSGRFDSRGILVCNNYSSHQYRNLHLVQMLPGNILQHFVKEVHRIRDALGQQCACFKVEVNDTSDMPSCDKNIPKKEEERKTDHIKGTAIANTSREGTALKYFKRKSIELNDKIVYKSYNITLISFDESKKIFSNIEHTWYGGGKLLVLLNPTRSSNEKLFKVHWEKGLPVLVRGLQNFLSLDKWSPESFVTEFGQLEMDAVNCLTGAQVSQIKMEDFFRGYLSLSVNILDVNNSPEILKLLVWPNQKNKNKMITFAERFDNLIGNLPIPDYTHPRGKLNLAIRPPNIFRDPDLRPQVHCAYSCINYPTAGTVNLHDEVCDMLNILVHVNNSLNDNEIYLNEVIKNITNEFDGDERTLTRLKNKNNIPGALWHIFHEKDADIIRDFLNKISFEKGTNSDQYFNPLHSNNWYLDEGLRKRLYLEHGVKACSVVQCFGDCIVIPALAPYQVKNLRSCIQVSKPFVSPQSLPNCYRANLQRHDLGETQIADKPKVNIKNILYFTMKDSLKTFMNILQ